MFRLTDPKHTPSIYAAAAVNVVKLPRYICFVSLTVVFSCLLALGQIMLYVDGMNGVIRHAETIQWLYTLVGSKVEFSCTKQKKKRRNSGQSSPAIV